MSETATVRDRRRTEIVAAAQALVAGGGLDALTIGALERSLSFTRGVITYHFENKDEILEAVLASAVAEIDQGSSAEVAAASKDARAGLRAIMATKVRGYLDHPEACRVLLAFWGRLDADPRARQINAALYRRYRGEAAGFLAWAAERGQLATADADAMATVMVGLVLGIVLQQLFEPGAVDPDLALDVAVEALIDRLTS